MGVVEGPEGIPTELRDLGRWKPNSQTFRIHGAHFRPNFLIRQNLPDEYIDYSWNDWTINEKSSSSPSVVGNTRATVLYIGYCRNLYFQPKGGAGSTMECGAS